MVRPPCREDIYELTKGPWTKEEDKKLIDYISKHGHEKWRVLPKRAGLNRCGKSCRLRWINYLRPDIKRGDFSYEEEQLIFKLHLELGNKWSKIASHLPRRTDNEIKNYWNTHMRKKLLAPGVDTKTHMPFLNSNLLTNLSLLNLIAYPNMNNAFYPSNNLQLPLNLMQMLNQYTFDPTSFLLKNAFDTTNQLQLSQGLMQIINPNPIPNAIDSFGGISYPQQEPFHGINNTVKNPQTFNTLPSVSNPMASFECELQPKVPSMCYNNVNTGYITETESSLPNLVSVVNPNIVNQVENNFSPEHSLSSIVFEDWGKFWDDEANVIQWP